MTHLDYIVDFTDSVIKALCADQTIRNLLTDRIDATQDDLEDDAGNLKYIFDYEFVNDPITESTSYICMETRVKAETGTMVSVELYVYVVCHKNHMNIDNRLFKGMKGNRRDNLIREIDKVLRGSRDFGIGRLELKEVNPFVLPANFTGRALVYDIPTFSKKRELVNGD